MTKDNGEISEYEKIRLENIARNESFLNGIGLPSQSIMGKKKKEGPRTLKRRVERVHVEGERKSSRIRNAPVEYQQLSNAEDDDDDVDALFEAEAKKVKKRVSTREVKLYETKHVSSSSSQSSRDVDCNYQIFIGCDAAFSDRTYNESTGRLTGNGGSSGDTGEYEEKNGNWVKVKGSSGETEKKRRDSSTSDKTSNDNCGRMLEEVGFGKAAIMAASYFGTAPKFSKYSGVVEWKNCVYLWVNIGVPGGDYNNSFSEKGKYITWFGGSKMHSETPVVQRLLKGGTQETVLLWVRLEKEPYTCLGPVKVVESDVTVHPVTMKWEVLFYDALAAKAQRCNFAAILKENDPPILLE